MAETILGNVLEFFARIGVYDVVLPFLLVFTIVYAIFERSKVLGTEDGDSKRNLNAMAAFVIAFLTIASSKLVAAITQISSQIVLLLLLGVFFLLLVGSFYEEGEIGKKGLPSGFLKWAFLTIMFLGILGIFLNAIKTDSGLSWLEVTIGFILTRWSSTAVASIILVAAVVAFMYYLTRSGESTKKEGSE